MKAPLQKLGNVLGTKVSGELLSIKGKGSGLAREIHIVLECSRNLLTYWKLERTITLYWWEAQYAQCSSNIISFHALRFDRGCAKWIIKVSTTLPFTWFSSIFPNPLLQNPLTSYPQTSSQLQPGSCGQIRINFSIPGSMVSKLVPEAQAVRGFPHSIHGWYTGYPWGDVPEAWFPCFKRATACTNTANTVITGTSVGVEQPLNNRWTTYMKSINPWDMCNGHDPQWGHHEPSMESALKRCR